MKLRVSRKWKKPEYTIGQFFIDGVKFSETVEDKDRGLSDSMPESEVKAKKIYGQTAIPTGEYEVRLTWSSKFHDRAWCKKYGGKCPQIMDVKGFQGIRIHPFNTAQESLGCIAVGENKVRGKVINSTSFFLKLMDEHIMPALKKGEKISIVIE